MKRLLASFIAVLAVSSVVLTQNRTEHERLKTVNNFSRPEDVVSYYVARDASGFVWSGLLEIERTAFTTWNNVPQSDTFFIAKDYKISPARFGAGAKQGEAMVEVQYALTAIGDGYGTRQPSSEPSRSVKFGLKKNNGRWKIVSPSSDEISPVVLENKFN